MNRLLTGAITLALLSGAAAAADKRPMQVEDLFKFKRVAAPQISPDGKQVVYQVTSVSLEENKSTTALWLAATDGKTPPKALTDPKGKKDMSPRWSPDGNVIVFESTRSGSGQLWAVDPNGGEPVQLTTISTGAGSPVWSPDLKSIAFVSAVYPEFSEKPFAESDKLNRDKDEAIEKNPVKAKVFTKLFYRHWVEYVDDKRQHLFVGSFKLAGGKPVLEGIHDATPGDRDAYPTSTTFSSGDDFTFTPDSKHLVFTAVPEKNESWSTNYDLCRVSVGNTSTKWESLTKGNPAADSGPKFSPDGKKLAWRVQKKAGYEADKWRIAVADCKEDGTLKAEARIISGDENTPALEWSANEIAWDRSSMIYFTADLAGKTVLWSTSVLTDLPTSIFVADRVREGSASGISISSGRISYLRARLTEPSELYSGVIDGDLTNVQSLQNISHANDALLAELDLPKPESVEVKIEDGKMQMWILKPPGFDPKKKWPVAYLVHGGPQGAWEDSWSFRWNAQAWAAQGYVVAMPNPRGSTGFGQKFVDEITGDWGGKCYRDLVAGLEYVEKLPYVDKDRIASAGGSFGGYMMNWFAVSEIAPRFKCLVTHCSVWNFESMWGTTDELWFDEWEHGGLPWEKPKKYAEFSPHKKAGNMAKHKVPMLIIHNDLDFRCPIGQGHELFSALQRQGVPSRFVNFPDEGHWVLKPKNSQRWHQEVFAWLNKYCPPGAK